MIASTVAELGKDGPNPVSTEAGSVPCAQTPCDVRRHFYVRKVAPGLYLGIGRVGFTKRQLADLRPFMLEGPTAAFAKQS